LWWDSVGGNLYVYYNDGNSTQWVPATNLAGSVSLTTSTTPPSTPKAGDMWFDSVGGQLYIYFNDGNSLQWVIANNFNGGLYLPLAGGTMTGPMSLSGDATASLNPVSLQQMNAATALLYPATNPSGFQTAANVSASLGNYLPLSGGYLSGSLTVGAGNIVIAGAGNSLFLYNGNSSVYADSSYFGLGEGGDFSNAGNWRYQFVRATGQRLWLDYTNYPRMYLNSDGSLYAAAFDVGSDVSLKRDIEDASVGLAELRGITPKHYWRIHADPPPEHPGWKPDDRRELGFVAQDVQAALPDAVTEGADGKLGVGLVPLIAALTNAVKELAERIEVLEAGR
jgi:hypothetical protein